ncbi:methyltransferase domain-containing protein [Isoptericola sp. b441]|uniref:Methyltransferase domain-containing protein n=1 Tax=Actinotalea lenta TaxID=3064654 RepID=A0ABT9DDU0_9CELL|nr:class I SAM-dependent methyltransferase [Isoptericola sp. b441]MDO8107606.1 methyltransferase domain-containing protein [Isoptericola sp. b441]
MIEEVMRAARRPEPFQPSEAPFWDDPYIAGQLLGFHLDDRTEAASRPSSVIARDVGVLLERGLAGPGRRVLDLGCGPGLYAHRLAAAGCAVTGLDLSAGSIEFARARAADAGLTVDYRVQDFRTLDAHATYDLVLQSFGEVSTFSDTVRDDLLRRIRRALAPGGALLFDMTRPSAHRPPAPRRVELLDGGLWRPGPHLVVTDTYVYPDDITCDQYVVADDSVVVYRMWFHDYTPATLAPVLTEAGLMVQEVWGSLGGGPPATDDDWFAVLARADGA